MSTEMQSVRETQREKHCNGETGRVWQRKVRLGVWVLEEVPVEIVFILRLEVFGLSDHNKHGQPGFQLWLR